MRASVIAAGTIVLAATYASTANAGAPEPAAVVTASAPFTIAASGLDSSDFSFVGTATDGTRDVLVFQASSLDFTGYEEDDPCATSNGVGSAITRTGSGTYSFTGSAGSSIVLHATTVSFTGLQSAWTPANPPAPSETVPASVTDFAATATVLTAPSSTGGVKVVAQIC